LVKEAVVEQNFWNNGITTDFDPVLEEFDGCEE